MGGVPPHSVNFFLLVFRKNSVRYGGTVSQQQFQPRMQITHDFIFDKLICYSYVQEYVIE